MEGGRQGGREGGRERRDDCYTGIGHNLFVQPASSSLIACPGRIPRQVERNTCHCCAT